MTQIPKIAIIYLSYHSEPYLDDFVQAARRLTYPKERLALVIVDNPHPESGASLAALNQKLRPLSGNQLPEVIILPQAENLGFAGGNNVGINWALAHDFDFVYLHNQDGFMAPSALEPLVSAMAEDPRIAIAQSLILLHPETGLINNAGNSFHYLGFGFCDLYKIPRAAALLPSVKEIAYASGAACLVRGEAMRAHGLLDEDFFLYHEDLEWSFRLRARGRRVVLVADSLFYHHYEFGRSVGKLYYMERNRYGVLLLFFKLPTLLLFLPMMAPLEIALWFFARRRGWIDQRRAVWKYWRQSANWRLWLAKRRRWQSERQVSDRYLLSFSSPGIYFQEAAVQNPALRYLGNPLMTVYYWLVVRGLIWW